MAKKNSRRLAEIEAKQRIGDQLLNELTFWVESRKHAPDTPVSVFGNKPSDIDRMLKAKGHKLNIDQLISYLITNGRKVEVVVT
jgi:predicted XRE-type DNA-binding protein